MTSYHLRKRRQFELASEPTPTSNTGPITWSWTVKVGEPHEHYIVDLRGYLPHTQEKHVPLARLVQLVNPGIVTRGRNPIIARHQFIEQIATSIKLWTTNRKIRPAFERLNQLKWLFFFLDDLSKQEPEFGSNVRIEMLSEQVGIKFADWLRHQTTISATRMNSVYTSAAHILKEALEAPPWRPSPFKVVSANTGLSYTKEQFTALIRMAKTEISKFDSNRNRTLKISKEVNAKENLLHDKSVSLPPTSERWMFQARNALNHVRHSLRTGANFQSRIVQSKLAIVPTVDLVCAELLLVMLRTGTNEQALLDIAPDGHGLAPGKWLQPNPFGEQYRTIRLWKSRSGERQAGARKQINFSSNAKPRFYPVRVLRHQELIGWWCRANMEIASQTNKSQKFQLAVAKAKQSFWVYWGESRWMGLNSANLRLTLNKLIKQYSKKWPALLDASGKPVKYSARSIRNAYLEFVAKFSGFSITTVQHEATHSPDSPSINNYLKAKWGQQYMSDSMREFQSAAVAVLDSDAPQLTPKNLASALSDKGREELVYNESRITKVQAGLRCTNPKQPPSHIYKLQSAEDQCPAVSCYDCPSARCFPSSLPELAREIDVMRTRRDQIPLHLWSGSSAEAHLAKLEELFSRFTSQERSKAVQAAKYLDTPLLFYSAAS